MKLESSRHTFRKYSDIKFHENPSSGRRIFSCRNFANAPKKLHEDNFCGWASDTENPPVFVPPIPVVTEKQQRHPSRYSDEALDWAIRGSIPGRSTTFFLFSETSWVTQPHIQWVPRALYQRQSGRGVKLNSQLPPSQFHLVPRLSEVNNKWS